MFSGERKGEVIRGWIRYMGAMDTRVKRSHLGKATSRGRHGVPSGNQERIYSRSDS